MVNVPADIVKANFWKKGVYLEINPKGNYGLDVRKFADSDVPRTNVELEALRLEEINLKVFIDISRANENGGEFSGRLAQFSCVQAKIRRLEQRLSPRE